MATSHAISVVKSHCYTAPRISNTDRPATAKELSREQRKHGLRHKDEVIGQQNDVSTRNSSRTATAGRYASHDKHQGQGSSLNYETREAVSEEQFYQNLMKLKEEHKKSLRLLETKYYDELRNQNSFQWEGFSHGVGLKQAKQRINGCEQDSSDGFELSSEPLREYNSPKNDEERVFHKPPKSPIVRDVVKDMSHSTTIASEDQRDDHSEDSDESEEMSGTDKDPRSPEEFSSSLFPKRSTAIDMVEDMWKDFSVRDYATTTNDETLEPHESEKRKEKAESWSPVITVPKPFAMTLREATKEKRKTRSMKMIEEDIVLKKSMEEAELKKKFRAQPVPATTFLPLYDEIMVKNNRMSEHVREINKAILKATEKPFGFAKREEEKKRRKEREERMAEERKASDEAKRAAFKARPPPKHMDDLSLADRLTEQDEYRKIRKKLRAADLLTKSRLPPSMEARANISPAAKSRQKCQRDRVEGNGAKPRFRPNINADVPDFDALHWEFEKELRRKKTERQPTVVEPFNLRTARIPRGERSLRRTKSMENLTHSLDGTIQSKRLTRPLSARLSSSQETLPFGITESVRLRDNAVRKSLELRKHRDAESSREMKERRKREKQLRSQVSVRAMANDHSWQLRKTSEGKLRSFRESDRGRQEEYENELAEMQRRVAQRPLLLEQESRANAKRKAERKYTQILRDAGVDENLVSRLVTKEGNIVGADNGSESEDASDDREHPNSRTVANGTDASREYLSEESVEGSEPEVEYDDQSL